MKIGVPDSLASPYKHYEAQTDDLKKIMSELKNLQPVLRQPQVNHHIESDKTFRNFEVLRVRDL